MTAIAKRNSSEVSIQNNFTKEQIEVLKNTIAKEATDEELDLFLFTCKRTGLDPFSRQIYLIKRWDSTLKKHVATTQTSIDGFRAIASRNPDYVGQTTTLFCGKDGKWTELWTESTPPFAAKVGIYRKNFSDPTYAIAKWDSYVQKNKDGTIAKMWLKFPDVMIGKCAEAQALRKAFPLELSGHYSPEEMAQATNEDNENEISNTEIKSITAKNKKPEKTSVVIDVKADQEKIINVPAEIIEAKNTIENPEKYDNKNLNHKEIFKKLILNIQSVKKIERTPENKAKISEAYQFFSSRCIGVPLNQLEDHLLSVEKEFQNAS
ncbi:phage recombination protein Bet (plasmid) [Pigmentibacter ruber]